MFRHCRDIILHLDLQKFHQYLKDRSEEKNTRVPTSSRNARSVEQWTPEEAKNAGIIAVLDKPDDDVASLAIVKALVDDELTLHYFGTRSKHWRSAKFNLAYIDGKTGKTILRTPLPSESATPWVGSVPLSNEFVVAWGLQLHKKKLTSRAIKDLKGYRPWVIR